MENNETLNSFFLELFGKIATLYEDAERLRKEIEALKNETYEDKLKRLDKEMKAAGLPY